MLLRAVDLVVRHHPAMSPTLAGVSLEIAEGEIVAIVGANGSGKSTLARALAGLVELERGRIEGRAGHQPRVGVVLQDPAAQVVAATVADEVALGPESGGHAPGIVADIVDRHLALHGLGMLRARDPLRLSGGQQQRVAAAAVGACDVDVLVLDEPTALLDPRARAAFVAGIEVMADGRGVAWITQDADELARCDRVVVLEAGTVAWTGPVADYVDAPHVARSFGLELPVAARVAHQLAATGAWPSGIRSPVDVPTLLGVLGATGGRGV